jgi:hypothetical protein
MLHNIVTNKPYSLIGLASFSDRQWQNRLDDVQEDCQKRLAVKKEQQQQLKGESERVRRLNCSRGMIITLIAIETGATKKADGGGRESAGDGDEYSGGES